MQIPYSLLTTLVFQWIVCPEQIYQVISGGVGSSPIEFPKPVPTTSYNFVKSSKKADREGHGTQWKPSLVVSPKDFPNLHVHKTGHTNQTWLASCRLKEPVGKTWNKLIECFTFFLRVPKKTSEVLLGLLGPSQKIIAVCALGAPKNEHQVSVKDNLMERGSVKGTLECELCARGSMSGLWVEDIGLPVIHSQKAPESWFLFLFKLEVMVDDGCVTAGVLVVMILSNYQKIARVCAFSDWR